MNTFSRTLISKWISKSIDSSIHMDPPKDTWAIKERWRFIFFHNTMCFHKMILLEIQAPIVYEYFSRVSLNCHSNQIFLNNIDIQKLVSHVHHEYVVLMLCHRKTTCYSMCKITFSDHVWHLYGSPDRSYVQSLSHTGHMYKSFPETNENIIYYWIHWKFEKNISIYPDFNAWIAHVYEVKRIICFMIYSGISYVQMILHMWRIMSFGREAFETRTALKLWSTMLYFHMVS